MRCTYESLQAGDVLFRVPETVVRVEHLFETVADNWGGSGTHNQPTGKIRLTTRLASVTSVEVVDAATLVHADSTYTGCDAE